MAETGTVGSALRSFVSSVFCCRRDRRADKHLIEHLVGAQALGFGFIGEADAMAQGIVEDFLDERGRNVVAAAQPRERAAGLEEGERGAGRRAKVEQATGT